MNVPLQDILRPLYDVELGSIMAEFNDLPPNERKASGERAALALRTIRKFVSSFGTMVVRFFEQDKPGGTLPAATLGKPGKSKGTGKGKSPSVVETEGDKVEDKAVASAQTPEPATTAKISGASYSIIGETGSTRETGHQGNKILHRSRIYQSQKDW